MSRFESPGRLRSGSDMGRRGERMSMMPSVGGGAAERKATLLRSPAARQGQTRGKGKRTLSVDTGMSALVSQFYEEKLLEAKEAADAELQAFLEALAATLAQAEGEEARALEQLRFYARQVLATDAFELGGAQFRKIVNEVGRLREAKAGQAPALVSRLFVIFSHFSRLLSYLELDGQEIDAFVRWAADEMRKHQKQRSSPSPSPSSSSSSPPPSSSRREEADAGRSPSKEVVVCRICEKKIRGDRVKQHTARCLQAAELEDQCKATNAALRAELKAIRSEARKDEQDRRATRHLTFVPGFRDERTAEEFVARVTKQLPAAEVAALMALLRQHADQKAPLAVDELVSQVKALCCADDRFFVLKGFVAFLPPDVQFRTCADIMDRIWRKEDAELRSREELLVMLKACVRSIIQLSPREVASFERCCKKLKQFDQLNALFLTKSCAGQLREHVTKMQQLIVQKYELLEKLFASAPDASVLNPLMLQEEMKDEKGAGSSTGVSIRDFEIVKPISRGSFGCVFLARKKTTGDIYAIKQLKKSEMRTKNEREHVRNERNVLALADNPFVVKMYYSFQTEKNLYMVMEYLNGGDCFSILREWTYFPEDIAKMYIAECVLALEYLHSHAIVHRDLKPDNMLIDSKGHIKLTDFGLSRVGLLDRQEDKKEWQLNQAFAHEEEEEAAGAVGTPDYIAPEVLLGTGCGVAVDWWALGCITYEFLIGITPFYGDTLEEIFENVLSHNIMWPEDDQEISPEAQDFINSLLAFDPSERLGSEGGEQVRAHPWLAGIDWANIYKKPGPIVPQTSDALDTSCFEARNDIFVVGKDDLQEVMEDSADSPSRANVSRFRGFSFINVNHLANATADQA